MNWRAEAARVCAIFALGAACALWVVPVLVGPSVQRLRLDRDRLQGEVEAVRHEVQKLKEADLKRRTQPKVVQVRVEISGPDDRASLEAERRLTKQLIGELVGKAIDVIDPILLYARLQGSLLKIDGVEYRLDVKVVSVAAMMTLYGMIVPLT